MGEFSAGNNNYTEGDIAMSKSKYYWQVVVEGTYRRVVSTFSTTQNIFNKEVEKVMDNRIAYFQRKFPDKEVYIIEMGTSIYRMACEMKGTIEYAYIPDNLPLSEVYRHINSVRCAYESWNVPATTWLEKLVHGQWVRYF